MVVVVELFFLEREALKRAVVDGSVHGLSVGGVRARERLSFDV